MPLMWAVVIGIAAFRIYRITGKDDITLWFHGVSFGDSKTLYVSWK